MFIDHIVNLGDNRERNARRSFGSDGKSDRRMYSGEAVLDRSVNLGRDLCKQAIGPTPWAQNANISKIAGKQRLQHRPVLLVAVRQDHRSAAFG